MHKVIRLLRILFENLFINYRKYDKDFVIETRNTLMSFNIRADHPRDSKYNWVHRRKAIIEMIKDNRPSIICMQEVQSHMFKWLYKRLYNQYECVEYAGNKKHTSLLNNLNWFSNGLVIWYDKSKYIKCFTKCITEEHNHPEKFLLVTTLISDKGFFGVVDTHYDSTYNHKRQMLTDKLNKVIKDAGHRVIVCGDFNASRNSNEVRNINLDYCVPSDGETQRTFNHFDETWAVIDFILSNIEIKEYEIVTKDYGVPYISDHYPITIEL